MVPKLLIVTNKRDPHADAVIKLCHERGTLEPVRLNSDDFLSNAGYAFTWDVAGDMSGGAMRFADSGRLADEVAVAWWRKPLAVAASPDLTEPEARRFAETEGATLLRSLPGLFPRASWVNHPRAMRAASHKLEQTTIAREVGLRVPETLVTNDGDAFTRFVADIGDVIVKPLDFDGVRVDDRWFGCFTRTVASEDLDRLASLAGHAPVFAQRRIAKHRELRVTVIGTRVFACAIDGQARDGARDDWRRVPPSDLPHRLVNLDKDLERRLVRFLELSGLGYGAFDLIEEPDGTVFFLEVNPNGQYLWIEHLTGAPLSAAMLDHMEAIAARMLARDHPDRVDVDEHPFYSVPSSAAGTRPWVVGRPRVSPG